MFYKRCASSSVTGGQAHKRYPVQVGVIRDAYIGGNGFLAGKGATKSKQ
jgi:hypothetical protein